MARLIQQNLQVGRWTQVRAIAGSPIAVDPIGAAPNLFVDASYPLSAAVDCTGWETVLVGIEIDAGTNPTAVLEMLWRDDDATTDGQRWKQLLQGALEGVTLAAQAAQVTSALTTGGPPQEMRVLGNPFIFPRFKTLGGTGTPTALRILMLPGYPMRGRRNG